MGGLILGWGGVNRALGVCRVSHYEKPWYLIQKDSMSPSIFEKWNKNVFNFVAFFLQSRQMKASCYTGVWNKNVYTNILISIASDRLAALRGAWEERRYITVFWRFKSSLVMHSHVAKRERLVQSKTLTFNLLSCKRCPYDNDFWPINLEDLNIILGAWNSFAGNLHKSCDWFFFLN